MRVLIDIDLSYVTRKLSRVADGAQRVEALLDEVGEAALREFGRTMDSEGFGRWPKLQSQTVRTKQRLGAGNKPMLQRTGAMRESFTRRGAAGNIFERGRMTLDVGSRIRYAHHHQQGNSLHPARPIVFMTAQLQAEINAIAARFLEGLIGG